MFDYLPDTAAKFDPRLLALRFLATSGARLTRAAQRIGGEAGAALAHALGDMMIDPTVDPMHWPIDPTLAMLRGSGAQPDTQVEQLIVNLSQLRDRIDDGSV
jgi:hypothetical protein